MSIFPRDEKVESTDSGEEFIVGIFHANQDAGVNTTDIQEAKWPILKGSS